MEFKNPKYTNRHHTAIECEINHEDLGWVPFVCPKDQDHGTPVNTEALFIAMVASGNVENEDTQTEQELADIAQVEMDAANRQTLIETDWYIIRHYETGDVVPENITLSRAAARSAIVGTLPE